MTQLANGKARLAIELIRYDPELESAMNFVFGNTVNINKFNNIMYELYSLLQMMKKQQRKLHLMT